MNLFGNERLKLSLDEDVLIKKILLTHDPDGRRLDSELLLRAAENIMFYITTAQVSGLEAIARKDNPAFSVSSRSIPNIEIFGTEDKVEEVIYRISSEMVANIPGDQWDPHARTMIMFDLLGNFRWDDKLVLILAAFAASYGKFWLIMQLYSDEPLAVSVAKLKQLPGDLSRMKRRFKALRLLVKTMVDVTKCIIKFEGLPFRHVTLDDEAMAITKSYIYVAAYWVIRSTLARSSQITDIIAMKSEQVNSDSTVPAAWELTSLAYRLSNICTHLQRQVDSCHQQIEMKMYQKMLKLFQESRASNQEVLETLLVSMDDLPLKDSSSQAKLGVSELKDKVVVLLVSKPELLPLEGLLLLVQQTYDHSYQKKLEGSYKIVWIPISFSHSRSDAEEDEFTFLSDSLPWYSVRRPWVLNSAVVNFIRQEWNYQDDPMMVVLDSRGTVTNQNATDMVLIWGARAYPFSSSREKQLWEEETWTMQLLLDELDPLLTAWVEEGRYVCIFGSDSTDWIKEFIAKLKEIRNEGVQLEMVYVGNRGLSENTRHAMTIINDEMHLSVFSFTKLHFFWHRLESMRRSKLRLGMTSNSDHILEEVSALLDSDQGEWALIGRGSTTDVTKLQGKRAMECLDKFPEWRENLTKLGFLGALKAALDPPLLAEPCYHSKVVPYAEGLLESTVTCDKCKRPMKKYVVYQ